MTDEVTDAPKRRMSRTGRLVIVLLSIAVAYLLISQVITQRDANVASEQATEAQQDAQSVADPLDEVCRRDEEIRRRHGDLCDTAAEVKDQPPAVNDPDPDDADPDDPERQDPEIQDAEQQDPETQDSEVQDPELADVEHDDPDPDDPEIQDPEIDDPPVPGPQGEPGPTCPPGYTAENRPYDPSPMPGDEETWWVCVKEGT